MINMRPEILSLGFVHFQETCQSICKIEFSDERKKIFCSELKGISDIFLSYDVTSFSPQQIKDKKAELDFLWHWALALDDRNGYTLSHEMRAMMDNLCSHWISNPKKYIFATTDGDFAFIRYSSSWDVLMDTIYKLYGLKFSCQLVTFTIPKHLFNDFLFVSIIYHEMGHFVDNYYNITDEVVRRLKIRMSDPTSEERMRLEFFPILQKVYDNSTRLYTDEKKRDEYINSYVGEYIADLFGAQYVGRNIINHIEFNRHGTYNVHTETHPSPQERAVLVNAFLTNDKANFLLTDIHDSFIATNLELKNRYSEPVEAETLKKGLPMTIYNDEELHSILQLGWNVYFQGASAMASRNGNKVGTTSQCDFYAQLNGAIKQSIHDYLK